MPEENQSIPPIVEDQSTTRQDVPQVEIKVEESPTASAPEPMAPQPPPTTDPPPAAAGSSESIISRLLTKARQAIKQRKEKKKQKILSALAEKGQLTNEDIRKLLRCSDATARRFLTELEKEGKIQQIGNDGISVHY